MMFHSNHQSLLLLVIITALGITLSGLITHAVEFSGSNNNEGNEQEQEQSSAVKRIEKSLNSNPKSAAMWLNAGATLMKEDDIAEVFELAALPSSELHQHEKNDDTPKKPKYHTIYVKNLRYNSELALIKSLELDRKQSMAWHYLASVLIKQTTLLSRKKLLQQQKRNNIFSTAKIGDQFYNPLEAIAESIRLDKKSGKSWAGGSHLLSQILTSPNPTLREIFTSSGSALLKINLSLKNSDEDDEAYDAVELAEKAIHLDKGKGAVLWRYAAKALGIKDEEKKKMMMSNRKKSNNDDRNEDDENSPAASTFSATTIRFEKTSFDSIQCMEKALHLDKTDSASWNTLCELLKNQDTTVKGESSSSSTNEEGKKTRGRFANIDGELVGRQLCLQKAVEQDPQSSQAWLALAHDLIGSISSIATSSSFSQQQLPTAVINRRTSSILDCIENGLLKSIPGQHFPDTVRKTFRFACSLLSLEQNSGKTISLKSQTNMDSEQCWDTLLSGTETNLGGTTAVASDPTDADSWEELGNSLLRLSSSSTSSSSSSTPEIFISGESYDAIAAFSKSITLRREDREDSEKKDIIVSTTADSVSSWIGLAKAIAVAQYRYDRLPDSKKRTSMMSSGGAPKVVIFGETFSSSLEAYGRAVEMNTEAISSWELLCNELMTRDLTATVQRSSVALHLDGDTRIEPVRIEQQMCFLQLFKRDPENLFAWTNFKILTEGAKMQIPAKNSKKNPPTNITSNLQFRLLAATRFPKDSAIWVKLGQTLVQNELTEAVFSRTRHMPTHQVFIRAVENGLKTNHQAWIALSANMSPTQKVNISKMLVNHRRKNLNRIDVAVQAVKITQGKNAEAWQNLGTYLAWTVLYDPKNDASIDTAATRIFFSSFGAGVGESSSSVSSENEDVVTSDDDESKQDGGEVVNAEQALAKALALDSTLFGAWTNLALVLRKKSQEQSFALATPEQKKLQLFQISTEIADNSNNNNKNKKKFNAAECVVRAIELSEGKGAVQPQPKRVVAQLYTVLNDMLSLTNRHVTIHGKTVMASDLEKKIKELKS